MTSRPRYIRHLTLDTGDQRDSHRDEVADSVIEILRPMLARAVAGEIVPIPGVVEPAGCTMTATTSRDRGILVTIWAPRRVPLVTMGVAPSSLASATLWREWIGSERDDRTPAPPWVAVRLLPGVALYPEAAHWLGDLERCLAWAWIG